MPTSFTVLFENCIRLSIVCLGLYGWYLAVYEVGLGWFIRVHGQTLLGSLYILTTSTLIPASLSLFIYLASGRTWHNVREYPAPDLLTITEPHPCASAQGSLEACGVKSCKAKWKPPRTHHCSTCGVCRIDFDHHCPWLGNCVTLQRRKAFLLLLTLFSLIFAVGVAPIAGTLISHISKAMLVSYLDANDRANWWDWPWSWIICCGPFGRYIIGAILGFRILKRERAPDVPREAGDLITQPYLRVVATAFPLLLLAVFCMFLALLVRAQIGKGITKYEFLKEAGQVKNVAPEFFVRVPSEELHGQIMTTAVPSKVRLYDQGRAKNWKTFWSLPLLPPEDNGPYVWPKLNPAVLIEVRRGATDGRENEEV